MKTIQSIEQAIELYFLGTHQGDGEKLRQAFHPNARITGLFQGEYCDWSLEEFINRVTQKPTAADKNEVYQKQIISIDATDHAAIAKAQVVVNGLIFIDYITLLKINNRWVIRNKSFSC